MNKLLPALLGLGMIGSAWAADPVPADFLFRATGGGGSMPYRVFVPSACTGAQSCPLIVFLHGAGEAGTNNTAQLNNNANGAMKLISEANQAIQPALMAAPQCPTNSSCWGQANSLTQLGVMLDQIAAEFNVDVDRVHATGLSMGGNGTWELVRNQPQRFASAVPMSGYGGGSATALADLPFWYFHAINDGTVGVAGSRNQVNALRAVNARVIYTEYATGGHGIWQNAYATPLLFRWMMAQRRGQLEPTAPPFVRIEQPTAEPLWLTDQPETVLAGVVDNDVATTSSVAWLRRGGPDGTANGTTLWTTPSVALPMGLSDFQVTATGSSYHAPYGGATTFNANLTVNRLPFVPDPGDTLIAINAAGAEYLAVDGTDYLADTAFEGGSTQVSTRNVANTEDDTLYNSWRWGNFAYRIPVSNGQYRVSLHFAETYNSAPGQRSFDVALQGVPILTAFDIAAEVGLDTATVRVFETTVSNNQLLIQFSNGSAGSARVDAVRIELAVEDLLVDGFETP